MVFELMKPGEKGGDQGLVLKEAPAADEELQSAVLSQIVSGLENLRMNDVMQATDPRVAKLNFDAETVYQSDNGLVFHVVTAQEGSKIYARIRTVFDEALAKKLEARAAAENAEAEKAKAQAKADEAAKKEEEAGKTDTAQPSLTVAAAPEQAGKQAEGDKAKAAIQLSNADEALKLNSKFDPWIFEFVSYQGDKFRKNRSDLVKKKEKEKGEKPEEKAAAAAAAMNAQKTSP